MVRHGEMRSGHDENVAGGKLQESASERLGG